MEKIIGLKELRQNTKTYIKKARSGKSFLVVQRSRPIFRIVPPEEAEVWEEVIDFAKVKKGGMALKHLHLF
ncbi:MAG: hypothetical protein G01um101433_887 [Parcubacteria group bacterium Gr01-1014_33]|nr:MAG: hypothetical protein G01um101433_887 [Parcubacteria group bacterium Gr01-1014_33]